MENIDGLPGQVIPPLLCPAEIPEFCAGIVERLLKSPTFQGDGSFGKGEYRALSSIDGPEGRFCAIFNRNIGSIQEKPTWCILEIGFGSIYLKTREGIAVEKGLMLRMLDGAKQKELPSLIELIDVYSKIYFRITSCWKRATLDEYPGIVLKRHAGSFTLYVKENPLSGEEELMNAIAQRFFSKKTMVCSSEWTDSDTGYHLGKTIYLWLAAEVDSRLNLKYSRESVKNSRFRV